MVYVIAVSCKYTVLLKLPSLQTVQYHLKELVLCSGWKPEKAQIKFKF